MDVRQVYRLQREAEQARYAWGKALAHADAAVKNGSLVDPASATRRERERFETAEIAAKEAQAQIGGKVFRVASVEALTKKIEKFQRKAEKLGSGEIKFERTGEKDVEWHPVDEEQRGIGFVADNPQASLCAIFSITYHYVIVSGTAPKLEGFEFLATVEHTPAGNIVREVPQWNQELLLSEYGREFDAREYRFTAPICDHCQMRRDRKDTFIVREESTGQMLQVGRNCLADFTGINDPMRAARLAEHYRDLLDGGFDEDEETVKGSRSETSFAAQEFLAQAAAFVSRDGYRKADWDRPTGESAWYSLLNYGKMDRGQPMYLPVEEQDRQVALKVIEWADQIDPNTPSDYLSNVRIAIANGFVTWRTKGIVASAITAYQRDEQKRVERELKEAKQADAPAAGFLGEPKERLRNVEATVTFRKFIPSTYERPYSKTILKFETPEGHSLTWFASEDPYIEKFVPVAEGETEQEHAFKYQRFLTEGDKITADFTVKNHEDSERWGKATIITRLALKAVEPVAE